MKKGTIFGGLGITASLYVILFVAVMYSGSTFIAPYVMPLICVLVMMLFGMAKVKGIQKLSFCNKGDRDIKIITFLIVAFLIYQLSFSYNSNTTIVFVERFFVYGLLLFMVPKVDLNIRIIRLIRLYSFPVAVSIILFTLATGRKSGGLVGSYQFAGMMMSISFGIMLLNYYFNKSNLDTLGMLLTFVALFTSGKRTFTMLAVMGYILVAKMNNDPGKKKKFIQLSVFLVFAVGLAYLTMPSVRLVVERFQSYAGDKSYNGRAFYWEAAGKIFLENKFFGIGMGCFSQYFDAFFHRLGNLEAYDAHNVYIQLLAEVGIIGEILFILLFTISLLKTLKLFSHTLVKEIRDYRYVLTCSLFLQIWFVIYCMTGNPLYGAGQCFIYFASLAMMISVRKEVRDRDIRRLQNGKH